MSGIRTAILTVSDRCSRGEATDTSGPALAALTKEKLGAAVVRTGCVPDEARVIAGVIAEWADGGGVDLILSTGGTGFSPRDVTPEAARGVIEREAPGLMELARIRCAAKTPRAALSRGVAGIRGRTLIVTLPGSERGARETLEAILEVLPHAVESLRGEGDHPRGVG